MNSPEFCGKEVKSACVGWEAIRRILSFPTSSLAISPSASSPSLFFTLSFPRCPPPPESLLYLHFSVHFTYLSPSSAPHLPLCLEIAERLLHTVAGTHVVCADALCVRVLIACMCVCVHAQEDQAADSWAKAKEIARRRAAD